MYPDWPKFDSDLVPLPECPGPKLKPFDFHGPQQIEFLDKIGEGLHSYVFKVRILGQIYALKVFRWVWDGNWLGPGDFVDLENRQEMSAFYNYSEPFSAECRAFGRLQETGYEDLAVSCFGYVLLDEDHERGMMARYKLDDWAFNGDSESSGYCENSELNRKRFVEEHGRPPPYRCIVKALGQGIDDNEYERFRQPMARQLLRDIIKFQKLGILRLDIGIRQMIDGKMVDFSTAITMPHFITNPELNPHLSPSMVEAIRKATFEHCMNDYLEFDGVLWEWNDNYGAESGRISVEAYPGGRGISRNARYNLRSRGTCPRLYTFVDPRKYGWIAEAADGGGGRAATRPGKQLARISKTSKSKSMARKKRLTSRPDMWYYGYEEKWAKKLTRWALPVDHSIKWAWKDGYIVPVVSHGERLL